MSRNLFENIKKKITKLRKSALFFVFVCCFNFFHLNIPCHSFSCDRCPMFARLPLWLYPRSKMHCGGRPTALACRCREGGRQEDSRRQTREAWTGGRRRSPAHALLRRREAKGPPPTSFPRAPARKKPQVSPLAGQASACHISNNSNTWDRAERNARNVHKAEKGAM